jgi:hypothetical protein
MLRSYCFEFNTLMPSWRWLDFFSVFRGYLFARQSVSTYRMGECQSDRLIAAIARHVRRA